MFDTLSDKLQAAFKKLRGTTKLSEADVDVALREVRLALLEADVNFKVVKDFVARVRERSVGKEVLEGLNPGQQVVKFVHDELLRTLAGEVEEPETDEEGNPLEAVRPVTPPPVGLTMAAKSPTVIMLCGLQGAGKTTLAGKLANYLRKQGKTCLLVACDVQRPAAIKQLQVVGEQVKTSVFTLPVPEPVRIAREAVEWAKQNRADVVILDTAGRLHIDDALMEELKAVKDATRPDDILLVLDSMTGQDAVNVAREFNAALDVGGFVLTKVDGDARGGAAISIRAVVGKPIKFLSVGEKMDALEIFYPDRMASRILGMGDVLTLIEKAEAAIDEKQALEMEKKLRAGKFDFEDFLEQMQQMRRLGPLEQILSMLPGVGSKLKDMDFAANEKQLGQVEAIIRSMTKQERRSPELMNGSRRKRIATGSGTTVQEVNQLLTQFEQMRTFMRQMTSGKMGMGGMPGMPGQSKAVNSKNAGKGGKNKKKGEIRFTPFGRS